MLRHFIRLLIVGLGFGPPAHAAQTAPASGPVICEKADGYHGIWYAGDELPGEYKYRISGGLATFSVNHIPMAIYAPKADKTFFVYGGMPVDGARVLEQRRLLIMVSYFDHKTRLFPRPRILLDRQTNEPFENPTLAMDAQGRLWVFVGAYGTARPAYVFRGTEPYGIDSFDRVHEGNFSLPQSWYLDGRGFVLLYTAYDGPRSRLCATASRDGVAWSEPAVLASIEIGHSQVSWRYRDKIGTAFNYFPLEGGPEAGTNLYYMESRDSGKTWVTAAGEKLDVPLTTPENKALVQAYASSRRLVYVKDLTFDTRGNPIILFLTARDYRPGPLGGPRIWNTARWTGREWELTGVIRSDGSLDSACLIFERMDAWWLVAALDPGPQRFYMGGEVVAWFSRDQGASWARWTFTDRSPYNHSNVRRPVDANPAFWVFWADGDATQPSDSRLYFGDREGNVYRLPTKMDGEFAAPELMPLPLARQAASQPASVPATGSAPGPASPP